MSSASEPPSGTAQVTARNIGGIEETDVDLEPGVTVLAGRNATNRTSFLQAIVGALGGSSISLKGSADEGEARLQIGDDVYRRTLERRNGRVKLGGEPYDTDGEIGDLFAYLLEDNEARRAVVLSDDLRDIVMRPVDAEAIRTEIEELRREKDEIDDEIERLESLRDRKPDLVEKRTRLQDRLESKENELEEKREELASIDRSVAESKDLEDRLDEALESLKDAEGELEDVRFRAETERESLEALREERSEIEDELEDLADAPASDLDAVNNEIERLRDHKRSLDETVNQLQRIVQFNREMLDGEHREVRDTLDATPDDVTEQLVEDRTVCWTCGSEVDQSTIESTVDQLRDLREETSEERASVESTLSEKKETKRRLESERDRRERLERRREEIDREIEDREEAIEGYEQREADLEDEIEDLEDRVAELEEREQGEVLSVHKTVNQLEFECERIESDIESVTEELEEIESELDRIADLQERREEITNELTELRTRIERMETDAVEAFNEHMQTVLDVLEYDNIERIWIERTEKTVREGRRTVTRGTFDLHIVRSSPD
ncbi:MAG: archaea-specific SMC-related protein, partial [Halanaeroarchaeum sp.]